MDALTEPLAERSELAALELRLQVAELAAGVHRMVREAIAVSVAQALGEPPQESNPK